MEAEEFNAGVRAANIRDPCSPQEIGYSIAAATGNADTRRVNSAG